MRPAAPASDRTASGLRWVARSVATAVAAFWLLVGVASGLTGPDPWTAESTVMAALIVASAAAVAVAWRREGVGGAAVLGCGAAHSTFAYLSSGHHRGLAILISGGPFLLGGALFLAAWRRSRAAR